MIRSQQSLSSCVHCDDNVRHWPDCIHWKYLARDRNSSFSTQPSASCGCVCLWRKEKQPSCWDDRGDIALRLPILLATPPSESCLRLTDINLISFSVRVCLCVIKRRINCIFLCISSRKTHSSEWGTNMSVQCEYMSLWTISRTSGLWMMKVLLLCSDTSCPFTSGLCDGDCQCGTVAFVPDTHVHSLTVSLSLSLTPTHVTWWLQRALQWLTFVP